MARHRRLSTLLELVARDGQIDVHRAADELAVSTATIRRDLDHLAQQQLVTRTRGGAVAHSVSYDLPLRYKAARRASEKERIGVAAAALVRAGDVVGFNGGTTTTEVARALASRADLRAEGAEPAVTVVTNALNIAAELTVRSQVKIVVTGGVARAQSYELIGPLARRVLEDLTIDTLFLGVEGIDTKGGATASHEDEANVNRLMVERSRRVVVVADASKLGGRAFARICSIDEITTLVTDADPADPGLVPFTGAGIEIVHG
ncbi:MAG: DeoR/GlpR family DNA-binding transcription regulator [Mycobacteriales bacterium]